MSQSYLSIYFSRSNKYISACWQRQVSSSEYRQGIRAIAACIATLRVELVLIDFSNTGAPTAKDQACTASFLKQALSNTSLRRSAHVFSEDPAQWQAYQYVMENADKFPYQTQTFRSGEEAKAWLFEGIAANEPEDLVSVPMPFSARSLSRSLCTPSTHPERKVAKAAPCSIITQHLNFAKITVDIDQSLLTLTWLRPVRSREYRYAILKAERALQEHQLEKMLINKQRMGVPTLDDQSWLLNNAIKGLSRCGLRRMAILSSGDLLQQIVNDEVIHKVESTGLSYQSRYFMFEDEALEWLQLSCAKEYQAQ
ncbi:MAG: hypothetical protein LPK03_09035 [Pontibacter sp.]|nr:hypothetical protein [Pontibacter sp.]